MLEEGIYLLGVWVSLKEEELVTQTLVEKWKRVKWQVPVNKLSTS